MPLDRLLAALLLTAVVATPAAAQQIVYDSTAGSWTLTSGPISYRLVRRAEQVTFDYFGATAAVASGSPSRLNASYVL